MSYKQTTNKVIIVDIASGTDIAFSDLIIVPHDVRKIQSKCLLSFKNQAAREDDQHTTYTIEARLGGEDVVLGAGLTGDQYTPTMEYSFANPKRIQGEYRFTAKTHLDATKNVAKASSVVVILTFHRDY